MNTATASVNTDTGFAEVAPVLKALYLCTLPFCRFSFKDGKEAIFMNGQYLTDNREEMYQLEAEIEAGHPHIYVDAAKRTVDVAFRDPVEAIKKQAIEEYLARQRAAVDPTNDGGTSDQGKLNVGNTSNAGVAAAGSTSTEGAAQMAGTGVTGAGTAKIAINMGAK